MAVRKPLAMISGTITEVAAPDVVETEAVGFTAIAGENLSGHRAVTPQTDGTVKYASPATIGNQPVWVTLGAATSGDTVAVVSFGEISEGSWSWANGNVYLAASGVLTQTAPTSGALVIVADATAPTSIFVERQQTIDL